MWAPTGWAVAEMSLPSLCEVTAGQPDLTTGSIPKGARLDVCFTTYELCFLHTQADNEEAPKNGHRDRIFFFSPTFSEAAAL